MAGFSFTTSVFKEFTPRFSSKWPGGYLETKFLELIVENKVDLEPLAGNCSRVLAWHVKTSGATRRALSKDRAFDWISKLLK